MKWKLSLCIAIASAVLVSCVEPMNPIHEIYPANNCALDGCIEPPDDYPFNTIHPESTVP